MTPDTELKQYQSDHDLLILLNERVGKLTEGLNTKTGDHEIRMRTLERQQWILSGGLLIAAFAAPFLAKLLFGV